MGIRYAFVDVDGGYQYVKNCRENIKERKKEREKQNDGWQFVLQTS
jgi:hypothetical protein